MHGNIEDYIRFILQGALVVYQKLLFKDVVRNAFLKIIFLLITKFNPKKLAKLNTFAKNFSKYQEYLFKKNL